MRGNDVLFAVALGIVAVALILIMIEVNNPILPSLNITEEMAGMRSFSSWDDLSLFLKVTQSTRYSYGYYREGIMFSTGTAVPTTSEAKGSTASDYSTTNIQVAGVDEADIVKNDGRYIYAVGASSDWYGRNGTVTIIDAFPPSQMRIVSKIEIDGSPSEIFIYNDKLVVLGTRYSENIYNGEGAEPYPAVKNCVRCVMPPYYESRKAFMDVYDVSDRTSPSLKKEIEATGEYASSRMINGTAYVVFSERPTYLYPMPLYKVDGEWEEIQPGEVVFPDWPDYDYSYNIFIGVDLNDLSGQETRKIALLGSSQTMYVSADNIYLASTHYDRYIPQWEAYSAYLGVLPAEIKTKIAEIDNLNASEWIKDRLKVAEVKDWLDSTPLPTPGNIAAKIGASAIESIVNDKTAAIISREAESPETTVVTRISLHSNFSVTGVGEVPGHILNQFSMDESKGYFRIATTAGQLSRSGSKTSSAVYVLGQDMSISGKLDELAPGESIYSVRFMGDRAYLVTFKKVDPFFVIDLSDPAAPKLLGKLKIPGYSDYLHPYDENHVIGLGKGAVAAEEGDFAWYQGVKLSLFDVSDVSSPKEVAKFEIGDRGTDSYALDDHKAFLFSKERNLLVIPILLAEIDESKYPGGVEPNQYGDYTFQGAYVMSVSPEDGFKLKGRISHVSDDSLAKSGDYYWSDSNVKRSLYMDDFLYTISDRMVKANSLSDLNEISSVIVSEETNAPYRIIE